MTGTDERAAVVGATGPTGRELIRLLLARGTRVRAVSRSADRATFPAGVEAVAANATEPAAIRAALDGCGTVFFCVGATPADAGAFVRAARNVADALLASHARCVQVSSYWPYAPLESEVLDESQPRHAGNRLARARRDAEDALRDAGATIAQLPDFYGPGVGTSVIQQPLAQAAAGRTTNWIGGLDTARECAFVPDAMRAVAALAGQPGTAGECYLVPGAGPITPREVCAIASRHLGREVRARGAGRRLLQLLALFSRDLRGFLPMVPTYLRPLRFDASRIRAVLGERDLTSTPHESAIPATLDSL